MKTASLLLAGLLSTALVSNAQNSPSHTLATVKAEWPGIHYDLAKIVRLDETHILVAIKIRGDATAKNPTLLGKHSLATEQDPGHSEPFTLTKATLVDQATGKRYKADATLPKSPYWGDPSIVANIRPNTWLQLAVRFQVPPPIFTAEGKKAEQKVAFILPNAIAPMKDILLPQSK